MFSCYDFTLNDPISLIQTLSSKCMSFLPVTSFGFLYRHCTQFSKTLSPTCSCRPVKPNICSIFPLYSIQHPISSFLATLFCLSDVLMKCHPSQEVYTDFIWKKSVFFLSVSQRALLLTQPDTLLPLDLFSYLLIICMTVLHHSIMLVIKVLNWLAYIFT